MDYGYVHFLKIIFDDDPILRRVLCHVPKELSEITGFISKWHYMCFKDFPLRTQDKGHYKILRSLQAVIAAASFVSLVLNIFPSQIVSLIARLPHQLSLSRLSLPLDRKLFEGRDCLTFMSLMSGTH